MDAIVSFLSSWPVLIQRAFTEHALAVAVITLVAVAIFVVMQQEWRPHSLTTNIAFVVGGWLVSVSLLAFIMRALRKGWKMLEQALPFAARLSTYLYEICERHPILALAIVGVGTTAYFLKRPWPLLISWGPVRALCAIVGTALAIHIAAPIADLVNGDAGVAAAQPADKMPAVTAEEAVATAIRVGDFRYVSARHCVDEVSGYPVSEQGKTQVTPPWTIGVKPLSASCYESMGHAGSVRSNKQQAYATEYNRRMYEHNRSSRGAGQQLGYAADRGGVHR